MERDPENYQGVEMVSGIRLFTISHLVGAQCNGQNVGFKKTKGNI